MCLAQQRSSATAVGGSGSNHGGIGTSPAAAGSETTRNRTRRWRHMIWNYGKQSVHLIQSRQKWREMIERWRQFKAWSKRNINIVNARVDYITLWVLNLQLNFTFFALPALFAIFLAMLSPYHDLQACFCGFVLVLLFSGLVLTKQGVLDLSLGSHFSVHRLFEKRETVEFGSDFSGVSLSVQMKTYKMLPLNTVSRAWGYLADLELPGPLKYLSIWLFSTLMKCNREEAEFECLTQYRTISQFFRRKLKPGVRPICPESSIVSPADGKLTHVGPVEGHLLEQVKGIRYSFETFLGPISYHPTAAIEDEKETKQIMVNSNYATKYDECRAISKCAPEYEASYEFACKEISESAPGFKATYDDACTEISKFAPDYEAAYDHSCKEISEYATDCESSFEHACTEMAPCWGDMEHEHHLFAEEFDETDVCKDILEEKGVKDMYKTEETAVDQCLMYSGASLHKNAQCGMMSEEISTLMEMAESCQILEKSGDTALFQAVIYLSPSDYHRFHSPTDWVVTERRHFPGKLYSVSPSVVKKMPGLFHTNERVVLLGRWQYGFFSMSAVGATNVGSICINFDQELSTNTTNKTGYASRVFDNGVRLSKGEEVGYFNFGSTIVLVFQAPATFQHIHQSNQRVKVGEGL